MFSNFLHSYLKPRIKAKAFKKWLIAVAVISVLFSIPVVIFAPNPMGMIMGIATAIFFTVSLINIILSAGIFVPMYLVYFIILHPVLNALPFSEVSTTISAVILIIVNAVIFPMYMFHTLDIHEKNRNQQV